MRKSVRALSIILILLANYYFLSYILEIKESNFDTAISDNLNKKDSKNSVTVKSYDDKKVSHDDKFFARIVIPKINVNRYLYEPSSYMNNVDRNIEILKSSSMPDEKFGNVILAAHNGGAHTAFFKRLDELENGDLISLYYGDKKYDYKVSLKYDILKTGKASIKRDKDKNTITLITCKGSDKQLIVIGYLE